MAQADKKKPGFALCLTYYLPNVSGLTLSAHELACHLRDLGYPVQVVAGQVPAALPRHEVVDGLEITRSPAWFRLGKALFMPRYGLDLWRALDTVGLVNVHLPNLDAAVVAIVAKLRGRKLIVSYISAMSKARPADRLMRAIASLPHLVAGLLADRIQVVSQDYAEMSTFCRLFRHKLVFAALPTFLKLFPDEQYGRRMPRLPSSERPFRIGYVGRIARQKSLGILIDALPLLVRELGRDIVIDLAGPAADVIGETYWREILAAVESSGGAIRHVGVLHGRELAAFYADLDVMVLPSTDRLESFGLVQVEAMLRGVPVVASDLPGMRLPVAETGMGHLFTPGDPAALAAAIADILRNGPPQSLDPDAILRLFGNEPTTAPYREMLEALER